MIKNCGVLTFACLFFSVAVFAQNVNGSLPVNDVKIAHGLSSTPGTDIVNVDLYTGIGTATIPIYDYSIQGLNLGISLSYNTKGIQVDQVASPIGLGWALNIGGEISRSPIALEDEVGIKRKNPTLGAFLYRGAWSGVTGTYQDKEYDMYNLSFGGRSLEAIWAFNDTNKLFTYPKSEISLRTVLTDRNAKTYIDDYTAMSFLPGITSYSSADSTEEEISFYIIDEKGNQFFFRPGDVEKKQYKVEESDSGSRWVTNRWVLVKVVTNTGAEIKYNYQWKYISYQSAFIETVTEYFKTTGSNPPDVKLDSEPIIWQGYIAQVSSIEYANGTTAIFHWDTTTNARCDKPGGFVVDSITIEGKYGNTLKNSITYKFNYSYFHTPNSNNLNDEIAHRTPCSTIELFYQTQVTTRLKLNSIDRVGNDHINTERYYSFDYHETPLPQRFTPSKTDFYGYFNDGYTSEILISGIYRYLGVPLHSYNDNHNGVRTYGTDKTPDTTSNLTYIQAGLLKKITNGLGGVVELNYSKPDISNPSCAYRTLKYVTNFTPGNVGSGCSIDPELEGQDATDGLVVSSVLIKDGFSDENDLEIVYDYSGGQRFFRGGYFWLPIWLEGNTIKAREYKNSMVSDPRYFRGSNHGFSEVLVTKNNYYTSEQLSKTKYEFSNLILPDPLTDLFTQEYVDSMYSEYYSVGNKPAPGFSCLEQYTGPAYHTASPSTIEQFMMGLLKKVTEFDKNNDITSYSINKYDLNMRNIDGKIIQRGFSSRNFYYQKVDSNFTIQHGGFFWKGLNVIPAVSSAEARVRYTKTVKRIGGLELITEYEYEYDYADNIKSITWTGSNNDKYRKEYYYVHDYNLFDTTVLKTALQYKLTERQLKVSLTNPSYDEVLAHSVIVPEFSTQKNINYSALSNAFGNGVWFLSRLGDVIPPGGVETRYKEKKYLPKIQFPHVYASTIASPLTVPNATSDENSAISATMGLTSLRKIKEYTLYDDISNVLEMRINEHDRYNSYVWDSRVGEKIAEVKNARFNEIAYTSFEGLDVTSSIATDYGNWTFDKTGVIFAPQVSSPYPKAITGKYLYDLNVSTLSTSLQPNIDYMLTFWADFPPKVMLGSTQLTVQEAYDQLSGWRLYTVKFNSGSQTTLTILDNSPLSGIGFIDEARLHPAAATMTTATYEPLFGVSTNCDERNYIMYTEYDKQGRGTIKRDLNGLIRTMIETKNQTTNN